MKKRDQLPSTDPAEIEALIERLKHSSLDQRDALLLERLLRLLLSLISLLQKKNASIKRLKRWLFGPGSDTRTAAKNKTEHQTSDEQTQALSSAPDCHSDAPSLSTKKQARRGHGRQPASAYTGASIVDCTDPQLLPGSPCPAKACRGHLYDTNQPAILIRLTGQPILGATRYEQQVLRCSSCQTRYTAPLPEGVVPEKYDPSADVAIALAKYSAGLPFHRLARLQSNFGVPLPESLLFSRCEAVADALLPVFIHLKHLAAQGQLLYADDTRVKILSCMKENKGLSEDERRGLQTTGIVARFASHHIALYSSGRRHAGENLDELLSHRAEGLPPPIQMGDALSRNWSREFKTIVCKCLAHARRQFVEIEAAFPQECGRVLDELAEVYRFDGETREMSDGQRLNYHQQHSGPVMESLKQWIEQQFGERMVEPNSSLGKALTYLLNHWGGLTRFLTLEGAPIENTVFERALRIVVLQRKNGLFYKTEHGAAVADMLMSLIETCRLEGVSGWDYLLAVVSDRAAARLRPQEWLPWNYMQRANKSEVA